MYIINIMEELLNFELRNLKKKKKLNFFVLDFFFFDLNLNNRLKFSLSTKI